MNKEDFDYETHERLRQRTAEKADSLLWTYKSYYKAAEWYEDIDRKMDWAIVCVSVALTIGVIWDKLPTIFLISLAVLIAVFSALRRVIRSRELSEDYYKAARSYHGLFDEFKDFIELRLSKEEVGLGKMISEFNELSEKRRTLDKITPDISSKWYEKLDEGVYEEALASDKSKEKLAGNAKLIDAEGDEIEEN